MTRTNQRLFSTVFWSLLVAVVGCYGFVHWRVIWQEQPLAIREPAIAIDTRGFLDPLAPRPYTLESIPAYTNLYGLGYLWLASPFVKFLPFSEYADLRLANAFFLCLLLILITNQTASKPTRVSKLFYLGAIYALFVRSPSMAASPDVLGCLLYTLAWVIAVRGDYNILPLFISIIIGIFAFLTKPYFLLIIPGVAGFLFLFRSKKVAIYYTLCAAGLFGITSLIILHFYPYYFTSVVGVHAAAASRKLLVALNQWGEFSLLLPIPCAIAVMNIIRYFRRKNQKFSIAAAWEKPALLHTSPPNGYAFGALVAAAALGLSLSWHAGAYMIYFWHLLLPLLALWILQLDPNLQFNPWWYCANLGIILALCPAIPNDGATAGWNQLKATASSYGKVYLDPYFDPLLIDSESRLLDNSQSEYILQNRLQKSEPILKERTKAVISNSITLINNKYYNVMFIIDGFYCSDFLISVIHRNYHLVAGFSVKPYYYSFNEPRQFGRREVRVSVYVPNKVSEENTSDLPKITPPSPAVPPAKR